MSGSSDSAECNSAGRTDSKSKSVFLANPGLVCSPFSIRLTINAHYLVTDGGRCEWIAHLV